MCLILVMSAGTARVVRAGGRTGPAAGGRVDGAAAWVFAAAGVTASTGWLGTAADTIPVSDDIARPVAASSRARRRVRRRIVMERRR